jgi:hypothetical protein
LILLAVVAGLVIIAAVLNLGAGRDPRLPGPTLLPGPTPVETVPQAGNSPITIENGHVNLGQVQAGMTFDPSSLQATVAEEEGGTLLVCVVVPRPGQDKIDDLDWAPDLTARGGYCRTAASGEVVQFDLTSSVDSVF